MGMLIFLVMGMHETYAETKTRTASSEAHSFRLSEIPLNKQVTIRTKLDKNKSLSVFDTGIGIWGNEEGDDNQAWEIVKDLEFVNSYYIKVSQSRLGFGYLSVDNNGNLGINAIARETSKWIISDTGDGFTITSATASKNLDQSNADTTNGAPTGVFQENGTDAQKWYFEDFSYSANPEVPVDNRMTIRPQQNRNKALSVFGSNAVGIWDNTKNDNNQAWEFIQSGNSEYYIKISESRVGAGYLIDDKGSLGISAFPTLGGNVGNMDFEALVPSKWTIIGSKASGFIIQNVQTGKFLVSNNLTNGSHVVTEQDGNQIWYFENY